MTAPRLLTLKESAAYVCCAPKTLRAEAEIGLANSQAYTLQCYRALGRGDGYNDGAGKRKAHGFGASRMMVGRLTAMGG